MQRGELAPPDPPQVRLGRALRLVRVGLRIVDPYVPRILLVARVVERDVECVRARDEALRALGFVPAEAIGAEEDGQPGSGARVGARGVEAV